MYGRGERKFKTWLKILPTDPLKIQWGASWKPHSDWARSNQKNTLKSRSQKNSTGIMPLKRDSQFCAKLPRVISSIKYKRENFDRTWKLLRWWLSLGFRVTCWGILSKMFHSFNNQNASWPGDKPVANQKRCTMCTRLHPWKMYLSVVIPMRQNCLRWSHGSSYERSISTEAPKELKLPLVSSLESAKTCHRSRERSLLSLARTWSRLRVQSRP
jgi:hypothetical protein